MQSHRGLISFAIAMLMLGFVSTAANAQSSGVRPLAKDVLKEIPSDLNFRDMFTLPQTIPDLPAKQFAPKTVPSQDTLFGKSRRVILYRDGVWQYEFAFTGLRQAKLKIPTGNGGIAEKNYWYLVYRIRDTNQTMSFEEVRQKPDFDHMLNILKMNVPIEQDKKHFTPRFTLEGSVPTANGYDKVVYRDVIDPIIVQQIRQREDKNQQLLDTHQMSKATIPQAKSSTDPGLWGVAVWEDVDPRIDYVSVFVKGLTNAFRLGRTADDPSKLKTLQLNFWRPGDSVAEHNDRVDYGIPLVDDPAKQALICERYNLPGPVIRGYVVNQDAKRNVLVVEADAQVNLRDFNSALTPTLDQGKLPASVAQAFGQAGITVDNNVALTTVIQGQKWSFSQGEEEFILILEPQFWERDFEGIRFIKRLDHMWIYR